MTDAQAIEILAAFNVIQLIFWGYQVHVLVNKLMCRNLAEYDLIKNGPAESPTHLPEDMTEENEILHELNGMLPGSAS